MESMLQEINTHKAKLLNLINNLINTQLINDEIFINNEIKKESEILNSLFNIKQNFLMNPINPMNLNNNINLNPLMIQPNLIMNPPQMNLNMNQFNFNPQQINENNNNDFLQILFWNSDNDKTTTIFCSGTDKISTLIEKYRNKANDYGNNIYWLNVKQLNNCLDSTLNDLGLGSNSQITVSPLKICLGSCFLFY